MRWAGNSNLGWRFLSFFSPHSLLFFLFRDFIGQKIIPEFRQHNWIFQGSTLTHPIGKHLRNGRYVAEKSWHFCMVSFLMRSCCATMAYVQICLVGATMKGAKLWCFGFLYRSKWVESYRLWWAFNFKQSLCRLCLLALRMRTHFVCLHVRLKQLSFAIVILSRNRS